MNLRRDHAAAIAGKRNRLAARHRVAPCHQKLAVMRIGRDPAIAVPDEQEIAVALQLIA